MNNKNGQFYSCFEDAPNSTTARSTALSDEDGIVRTSYLLKSRRLLKLHACFVHMPGAT